MGEPGRQQQEEMRMKMRRSPPHYTVPECSREPPHASLTTESDPSGTPALGSPLSLWAHPEPGRALSSVGPAESVWSCHWHSPTHQDVPANPLGFLLSLPGFPVQGDIRGAKLACEDAERNTGSGGTVFLPPVCSLNGQALRDSGWSCLSATSYAFTYLKTAPRSVFYLFVCF